MRTVRLILSMRTRRRTPTCARCRYDIADMTEGVCPECGYDVSRAIYWNRNRWITISVVALVFSFLMWLSPAIASRVWPVSQPTNLTPTTFRFAYASLLFRHGIIIILGLLLFSCYRLDPARFRTITPMKRAQPVATMTPVLILIAYLLQYSAVRWFEYLYTP